METVVRLDAGALNKIGVKRQMFHRHTYKVIGRYAGKKLCRALGDIPLYYNPVTELEGYFLHHKCECGCEQAEFLTKYYGKKYDVDIEWFRCKLADTSGGLTKLEVENESK